MEPAPGARPPAATPPPAPPKGPVRVSVMVLAIRIALAGFAVWWVFFKPYTIAQLDAMARECVPTGSLCQIPEGRTIYVAGTVTRLDLVNVSTGVRTAVFLDGGGPLLFAGDRRAQFAVGPARHFGFQLIDPLDDGRYLLQIAFVFAAEYLGENRTEHWR